MTPTDADLRRYLLGQLSTADAEAVEAAYFADGTITARLDDLADDLTRGHLDKTLDAADRAAFERLPDTPARAVRAAFVRHVDRQASSRQSSVARYSFWPMLAVAATAIMAMGTWWATTLRQPATSEPDHVDATPTVSTPAIPAPATPSPTPPVVIAALMLPTTATRSSGPTPAVAVSADVTVVAIRVTQALPPLADLTAEIRGVDTAVEWRGRVGAPGAGAPATTAGEVVVPSGELPAGDYVLTLRRADDTVSRAFFRVVRP